MKTYKGMRAKLRTKISCVKYTSLVRTMPNEAEEHTLPLDSSSDLLAGVLNRP